MIRSLDPALVLEWYGVSCIDRYPTLDAALRRTRNAGPLVCLEALEVEARTLALQLLPADDAATFSELTTVLVAARAARRGTSGPLEVLVSALIEDKASTFAEVFDGTTVANAARTVEAVMGQVEAVAQLTPSEAACIRHVRDFAGLTWVDDLVRNEPLVSDLVIEAINTETWVIAGGLAALKALAASHPVPNSDEARELVQALRERRDGADEAAIARFIGALVGCRGFLELARDAALTRHGPLLTAFARIAPYKATQALARELAIYRERRSVVL